MELQITQSMFQYSIGQSSISNFTVMINPDAFREHVVRLLDWEDAHAGFDRAVAGLAADKRGARAAGFEHSPWQLLEHLRSHRPTFSISA